MEARFPDNIIGQVYNPKINLNSRPAVLEKFYYLSEVRYYNLGRKALEMALICIGMQDGDLIAVPQFICHEVVDAITQLNLNIVFYPVDKHLRITKKSFKKLKRPPHGVLVVNYFGFPQDMTYVKKLQDDFLTKVIEDNAHGFLSKDSNGEKLGERGDIGILSMRKSIPYDSGAALLIKKKSNTSKLPPKLPFYIKRISLKERFKSLLRKTVPLCGTRLCYLFDHLYQRILGPGNILRPSLFDDISSQQIFLDQRPFDYINKMDFKNESKRRRELYLYLEKHILELGGIPIFSKLGNGVVPYQFPFRSPLEERAKIKQFLSKKMLHLGQWPAIYQELLEYENDDYLNINTVSFLW